MSWTVVRAGEAASQPWRNGGGVTRELLAWPSTQGWSVRVSLADVECNGPFSAFPGIERWFAVLSGAGVRLAVDGASHRLTPSGMPLRFDGAAQVDCELLDGATRDLNLMVRDRQARMDRVSGTRSAKGGPGWLVAAFANEHDAMLACGAERLHLAAGSLAWRILDSSARVELVGDDALWMEVKP